MWRERERKKRYDRDRFESLHDDDDVDGLFQTLPLRPHFHGDFNDGRRKKPAKPSTFGTGNNLAKKVWVVSGFACHHHYLHMLFWIFDVLWVITTFVVVDLYWCLTDNTKKTNFDTRIVDLNLCVCVWQRQRYLGAWFFFSMTKFLTNFNVGYQKKKYF